MREANAPFPKMKIMDWYHTRERPWVMNVIYIDECMSSILSNCSFIGVCT